MFAGKVYNLNFKVGIFIDIGRKGSATVLYLNQRLLTDTDHEYGKFPVHCAQIIIK